MRASMPRRRSDRSVSLFVTASTLLGRRRHFDEPTEFAFELSGLAFKVASTDVGVATTDAAVIHDWPCCHP